jgi:hypothetical protein
VTSAVDMTYCINGLGTDSAVVRSIASQHERASRLYRNCAGLQVDESSRSYVLPQVSSELK